SGKGLTSSVNRSSICNGCTLQVNIDVRDVICVNHVLILLLQTPNVCTTLCQFLTIGPTKGNSDITSHAAKLIDGHHDRVPRSRRGPGRRLAHFCGIAPDRLAPASDD